MIIRRKFVTLYHVTKVENVPSILIEGLLISKVREREENKLLGINQKAVYLVKDKTKLVKPLREGKDCILEVNIPEVAYNKMKKVAGDLAWGKAKDMRGYCKIMKKAYPESFANKTIDEMLVNTTPSRIYVS